MYSKEQGKVVISEAGPRFEMQPYEIRLGTIEQSEAEKEWVLRPYMNTSRKKQSLLSLADENECCSMRQDNTQWEPENNSRELCLKCKSP